MSDLTSKERVIEKARRVAKCVYIAVDEPVAKDIADTIYALLSLIPAHEPCPSHSHPSCPLCNPSKTVPELNRASPPPLAGLNKVLEPEKYGNGYRVSLIFLDEGRAAEAFLELDSSASTKGESL